MKYNIEVNILRHPTGDDWERCKDLAMRTIGKRWTGNKVTEEWKHKMLECRHSPIRTLMFTIEMVVPYFVSVHFVRHKIGVEHYVKSQRNDRQSEYDRELAPQNAMVCHTMDINAESLMIMSNRRLCNMADPTTHYVMYLICKAVEGCSPEFNGHLVPQCEKLLHCPEFKPCGYWKEKCVEDFIEVAREHGFELTPPIDVVPTNGEQVATQTLSESDLCSHY